MTENDLKIKIEVILNKFIEKINDFYLNKNLLNDFSENNLNILKLQHSLLFLKYSNLLNSENYKLKSVNLFEEVYNSLEENINGFGIYTGIGSVSWYNQYFVNNKLITYDNDFFDFFDKQLLAECKKQKKYKNFDLFSGLLSYGNYFYRRALYDKKNVVFLKKIERYLIELKDENGIISYDSAADTNNPINIGLAHGLPSQIVFFSKSYELTKNKESIQYAKDAIDFILKYRKTNGDSMFPSVIDLFNKSNNLIDSRLAWCYGDLGIAYAILYYSKATKDNIYKDIAIEIIKHSIKRVKNTGVNDKCFCHGTSGLFYLFYKLYTKFNIKICEKAYKYWLKLTLENYKNLNSFETCALNIELNKKEFMLDLGLIEGITGIGLSLVSYIDKTENEWEDFFML
jgi:hypothetical protein